MRAETLTATAHLHGCDATALAHTRQPVRSGRRCSLRYAAATRQGPKLASNQAGCKEHQDPTLEVEHQPRNQAAGAALYSCSQITRVNFTTPHRPCTVRAYGCQRMCLGPCKFCHNCADVCGVGPNTLPHYPQLETSFVPLCVQTHRMAFKRIVRAVPTSLR